MTMLDTEVSSSTARTAGLGRLFAFLLPATTAMYAAFNGVSRILVPSQVEGFDPGAQGGNLAVATRLAALSAGVAVPLGRGVSDRTRSRFGSRSPWILAMSVLSAALL